MEQALVVSLVILVVAAMIVRFEVFCLKDLAATDDWQLRGLNRRGWMLVCLLSVPFGGIAYLYLGKNTRP